MHRSAISVAALLFVTVVPIGASAVPMLPTPFIRGPAPEGPTPVRLVREMLEVRCDEAPNEVPCEVVVRLLLENPTPNVIELPLRWRTEYATASLHGDLVRETGRSTASEPDAAGVVVLPPGRSATVELRASVTLWPADGPSPFVIPALSTRHLLLGDDPNDGAELQPLDYATGWGAEPRRSTEVEMAPALPSGWALVTSDTQRLSEDEPSREVRAIRLSIRRPPQLVFHGGPFIAAGGSFQRGFRLRGGYEIGFVQPLLASVSVETGFDDLVIAALIEVALPQLMVVVPSLGLGLGVPVRVVPDVEVGMRIELSAVAVVGFISTFDYYPGTDHWEVALLGRVSI
jgi:hypothetical protein